MSWTVYKYTLEKKPGVVQELDFAGVPMAFQAQDNELVLWSNVELKPAHRHGPASPALRCPRRFVLAWTGQEYLGTTKRYIGTAQTTERGERIVWHLFVAGHEATG